MSKKEKLLATLLSDPATMPFQDVNTLLNQMGLFIDTKGKTSGSRIVFRNDKGKKIVCHKPHDGVIKRAQLRNMVDQLNKILSEEEQS